MSQTIVTISAPQSGVNVSTSNEDKIYVTVAAGFTGTGGGGGGGNTNLSTTRTATTVTVVSDSGTDATIPAADGTNAGVMTSAMQTKLAGIEAGAEVNDTASEILTKLLTVDGSGSGLDADTLDGNHATAFAAASHTHAPSDITPIGHLKLIGRHGAGAGPGQEIGIDGGLEFNGANIRRAALTGDVTASAGDNVTTIANNAVTNVKVASGIDAVKIGDGSVSNTEFQTLNGVTSAIQTQLDGKVDENAAITPATKTKITYDAKGLVTSGADATTADIADSLNKRYVTDADLTKLSNTSGTNTGDQNLFSTIAVSGQSNVVADTTGDTLTLVAGSNVTITTDASTDSITISAAGSGGVSDGDKGDITVSSSGTVWTIDNDAVTYAKIQNVSNTNRILGRSTAGAGDIEEITVGGDLTQSGSNFTIANNAVSLAKIQDITTARIIGRVTAGTGDPEELTGTQATTLLDTFTSSLKGLAPASGGGTTNFLRADGTWAAPSGGGGGGADGTVLSPSQITAWQNNYNPSGWASTVGVLRINSNQFHFLSGLTATADGHTVRIINTGSFPIGLYNQNTDSTAGNRFSFDDHDVIILPGNSVELFYDNTAARWRLAAGYCLNDRSPYVTAYWNECYATANDDHGTLYNVSGNAHTTADAASYAGARTGITNLPTGTGTTNRAFFYPSNANSMRYDDGTGNSYMEYRAVFLSPSALSDATNTYAVELGFMDAVTSGSNTDGALLYYRHDVSSGNWSRVTANNGTTTTSDSGVAFAANTWYTVRVVLYPNDTAEFYVNGTSVGRNTTNLPTNAASSFTFGAGIRKSAGATNRAIDLDGIGYTVVKYTK